MSEIKCNIGESVERSRPNGPKKKKTFAETANIGRKLKDLLRRLWSVSTKTVSDWRSTIGWKLYSFSRQRGNAYTVQCKLGAQPCTVYSSIDTWAEKIIIPLQAPWLLQQPLHQQDGPILLQKNKNSDDNKAITKEWFYTSKNLIAEHKIHILKIYL